MLKTTTALVAILLAAGCVSAKSTSLDDRTVIVSAKGGAIVDPADVYKAALVKAAQLAQQRGAECFQVLGSSDTSRTMTTQTPATIFPTGGGTYMAIPGPTNTNRMPAVDLTVRLGAPCDQQGSWNARSVLAQAGQK